MALTHMLNKLAMYPEVPVTSNRSLALDLATGTTGYIQTSDTTIL